ncbi:hypothetical protein BX666DRAFT_630741 [Dichotomocladium elegans]|nr:hypothetical protein BX666DRAFT_630741 [Dichotomocladium elegans]
MTCTCLYAWSTRQNRPPLCCTNNFIMDTPFRREKKVYHNLVSTHFSSIKKKRTMGKLQLAVPRWRWSWRSFGNVAMAGLLLFDFIIIRSPPLWVRLPLVILLVAAIFTPYIRRFIIPAMPTLTWGITFYAARFIPTEYRPTHIFVNLLPTLERILYGANLSAIISQHQHPVLDILAWLPYGVIHFSFPLIFAGILFVFGPPLSLPVYGLAFGWMNVMGVLTQLLFPNASPWYELSYGSAPADYDVPGEAGGLSRIDKILGLDLYGSSFGASPLVFGAFPSLHSGSATIEMCFVVYLFPRLWPVAIVYVMWLWFATMYLTHHYMVDLVGGSIYAFVAFFIARKFLPPIRKECKTRLHYMGFEKFSLRDLIFSIEFNRNFSLRNDSEKVYSPMVEANGHTEDEEESVGLTWSGTDSPLEPASPTTPRTPLHLSQLSLKP